MANWATDMPILANCPTMMGQANSHKARISVRTGLVLEEGREGAVGMSAGFYGWGVPT